MGNNLLGGGAQETNCIRSEGVWEKERRVGTIHIRNHMDVLLFKNLADFASSKKGGVQGYWVESTSGDASFKPF